MKSIVVKQYLISNPPFTMVLHSGLLRRVHGSIQRMILEVVLMEMISMRWSQRWSMIWSIQMISDIISMFRKIMFDMIHGMIYMDDLWDRFIEIMSIRQPLRSCILWMLPWTRDTSGQSAMLLSVLFLPSTLILLATDFLLT